MPWTSRATPCPGAQSGSSWSPIRCADSDHCVFRWLVGATTTSRRAVPSAAHRPSWARAHVSANVVLPAPGVATARKSAWSPATN
jgi:hypothetical protein